MIRIDSSFRDPDGFIFNHENEIYRAVNHSYKKAYDHLINSGLYQKLVEKGYIIPFVEVDQADLGLSGYYKILKPEPIRFISYPYEWAFNMLKDAALLTLEIQKTALEFGMSLKDASAFNVQFQQGKPVFIDTLSFEFYQKGSPWVAYKQYCEHFLAPLALMAHVDPTLNRMLIHNINGIPLEMASKMLPTRTRLRLGLLLHIFLHAKAQRKHKQNTIKVSTVKRRLPENAIYNLIEGLKTTTKNQKWIPEGTQWANYNDDGVHLEEYVRFKTTLLINWLTKLKPGVVWDLGANEGYYSRLAAHTGASVLSFDIDPSCIKKNYATVKKNKETQILPLFLDLLNVTPSVGWGGNERLSVYSRNKPTLIMALALVHHLAIMGNIPLNSIASLFASLADKLIIEFVPKEDEKVQLLLMNRYDIFPDYTPEGFENAFLNYYTINEKIPSDCNNRIFYLMTKK